MNIGIVGPNAAPGKIGGLETLFLNLLDALGKYDENNHYYVYLPSTYNRELKLKENFEIITPKPALRLRNFFNPRIHIHNGHANDVALRNFYEAQPVDLLHFPFTTIHPLGINKVKVLTFADLQQEYLPEFFDEEELRHRKRSYKPSAEEANHIISISDYTRKGLIEKYEIEPDKITTVYLTYNDKLFRPVNETSKKSADPYFFYPAGRWKHKNHLSLINAFANVVKNYPKTRLKLTGTVQDQDDPIQLQISRLGLEDRVDFLGHVEEKQLPALYQNAVALIFPSLFEGFGIPIIEAMACGCPVVCSNTTSLPEIGGNAVYYFDPKNTDEITDAMIKLMEDRMLRRDLKKAGFEQVKKFNAEKMAREIVGIYESVIAKN